LRKLFDYYKDDAQNVVAKSVTNHIVRQSMLLETVPLFGLDMLPRILGVVRTKREHCYLKKHYFSFRFAL
jgi:hypothetical protein